jgi:hypothetical protein
MREITVGSFRYHSPIEAVWARIARLSSQQQNCSLPDRVMSSTPKAPGVSTRGNRFLLSSGPLCPGVNDGASRATHEAALAVLLEEADMDDTDLPRGSTRYILALLQVGSAAHVYPRILTRSNMMLTNVASELMQASSFAACFNTPMRITPTLCVSLTIARPFNSLDQYCLLL